MVGGPGDPGVGDAKADAHHWSRDILEYQTVPQRERGDTHRNNLGEPKAKSSNVHVTSMTKHVEDLPMAATAHRPGKRRSSATTLRCLAQRRAMTRSGRTAQSPDHAGASS